MLSAAVVGAVMLLSASGNARVLALFGEDPQRIITTVGAEQEYFLIDFFFNDKCNYVIYTGRTLFGAMPPKGQEMDDHYFGTIRQRISAYM